MSSEKDTTRPKSVSTVELNRRWQATRKAMKEARLDFLLIENAASLFPGHIRWFTDMTVADGDPTTLIFPREDDITTITFGDNATNEPMMLLPVLAGVKKRFSVPMLPNLKDTGYLNAEIVVEALKSYRNCRIGLVGLGFMSVAFYQYVTSHLESAKFVDATDLVDTIKVIKSQEEISLIRDTCRIQDEVFDYLVNHVQPGRKISEIRADASRRCSELGANKTNMILMVMGKMPSLSPIVIEPGDQIVCLIESDGPSGFWGELCRTICLGKISPELQEQYTLSQQAQKISLELMKPGVSPIDLYNANNEFLQRHGYPVQNALYGHGQGYDIAERPGLDPYEKMRIQVGMNIAVHPIFMSKKAVGWVCENYVVSENGNNECLHQTPQKVFVI